MKKIAKPSKAKKSKQDDLRVEYDFDYRKARPNRFARRGSKIPHIVALDPDVAKVFVSSESVNRALRAIISVLPR
jgi:hypothetical protein